jgi:hypothetical protein
MAAKKADDDRSLKRLGGGRWQTRDERFTIEPQSGTWALVDAEQADDLGLPLVRGPFRSLTEAKAAVEAARGTAAPKSPLAGRVIEAASGRRATSTATKPEPKPKLDDRTGSSRAKEKPTAEPEPQPPAPGPPPEPRWIADLGSRDRGRARRLIEALEMAGVRDAENVVRQDVTGGVPTVARVAIANQVAALLPSGGDEPRALEKILVRLLEALDDGRADDLGVRWRLVDDDNRPIGLTAGDLRAAVKRRAEHEVETKR